MSMLAGSHCEKGHQSFNQFCAAIPKKKQDKSWNFGTLKIGIWKRTGEAWKRRIILPIGTDRRTVESSASWSERLLLVLKGEPLMKSGVCRRKTNKRTTKKLPTLSTPADIKDNIPNTFLDVSNNDQLIRRLKIVIRNKFIFQNPVSCVD